MELKIREFRCTKGTSKKFWIIHPPIGIESGLQKHWMLHVEFGRIGTDGQGRSTIWADRKSAVYDYERRINDKLRKGYGNYGPPVKSTVAAMLKKPKKCKHDSLSRAGSKWKCVKCKKVVEFGEPDKSEPARDTEKKVRRFINLNWRQTA